MTIPNNRFVLLACLALSAAPAFPASASGDKWALLVGVDKCKAVGELTVCSADAHAMKSALERIGFPSKHVNVLTDDQPSIDDMPTLSNLERAIKRLAEAAEADDTVLFFFSGHGVTADGASLLVPTDGDLAKGVSLAWIRDQFAACKAKEKVMILDACHSGAAKGVSGIAPDLKASGSLVMLLSCEKDQVSWPDAEGRHSVFTAAVLEGLAGKAANAERKVTHLSLADYVRRSVKDWTFENKKNRQTPVLVAETSGDIVLADIALMKPADVMVNVAAERKGPSEGQPWTSPTTGMEFVWVPALKLWVGKYEVTNAEYRKKVPDHDSKDYKGESLNGERQPVVLVNFDDAKAYAEWLTERDGDKLGGMRYRLPSEAEWQACAQCGDGREYPWGNAMPPKYGNYSDSAAKRDLGITGVDGYTDGYAVACPVEKSGTNEWGLYGLGGNVWECCASDASGSAFGAWRGASWCDIMPDYLRCAFRFYFVDSLRYDYRGFRLSLSR